MASFVLSLPFRLILVVPSFGTSIVYVVSESAGHVTVEVVTSIAVMCPVAFEVTEAY